MTPEEQARVNRIINALTGQRNEALNALANAQAVAGELQEMIPPLQARIAQLEVQVKELTPPPEPEVVIDRPLEEVLDSGN